MHAGYGPPAQTLHARIAHTGQPTKLYELRASQLLVAHEDRVVTRKCVPPRTMALQHASQSAEYEAVVLSCVAASLACCGRLWLLACVWSLRHLGPRVCGVRVLLEGPGN